MSPKVRKYIYMLLTPAAGIAVYYGLVNDHEAAMWVGLIGAALMVGEGGLAAVNTPVKYVDDAKSTLGDKLDSAVNKLKRKAD